MAGKHRKIQVITILLMISLLLVISWVVIPPCRMATAMIANKPYFVDSVWPQPGARIPAGCYIRRSLSWPVPVVNWVTDLGDKDNITPSIAVKIYPEQIVEELDERIYFSKRIILYIDDKKSGLPEDMLEKQLDIIAQSEEEWAKNSFTPGWYHFGWYPMLFPGEHKARFVIVKKDGTTLEYEWHFTITWW